MSTSHHQCVYLDCSNNDRSNKDVSYFRFPVKDIQRMKQWQKNCGNITVALMDASELKFRAICEKHFMPSDIIVNNQRKLLQRNSVPIQYNVAEQLYITAVDNSLSLPLDSETQSIAGNSRTYSRKRKLESNFSEEQGPTKQNSPKGSEVRRLSNSSDGSNISDRISLMPSVNKGLLKKQIVSMTTKIMHLRRKIKSGRSKCSRLKRKVSSFSAQTLIFNMLKLNSTALKTFVNMQLFHGKSQKWSQAEKNLALSLHYKSPASYKFMLHTLRFVLPSLRTVQSWSKVCNLKTGVKTTLINKLALKAKTMMPDEKLCVVLFDEMSLKKMLEFNQSQDIIEGYQDLGTIGRESKLANTALVFQIRGLLFNWRIPFGYFISSGPVKSDALKNIIVEVITTLKKLTFSPRVIVSDQGSNNRKAVSLLGASKENPCVDIAGDNLFTIFDAPHLLKSLRNNFMNWKLQFFVDQKPISWQDLQQTYDIDQKSMTTRAMPKITNVHIAPNTFQKMRVKYAAQIFSHTVAAAIKTVSVNQQLNSSTAYNTAEFVGNINDIFDALNSRDLHDPNPHRRPLSVFDKKSVEILEHGLNYFKNIEIYEGNKKRNNIYCLEGFEWSIKAILLLWTELQKIGIKYLLTSFLNQDPLENFFSVVRNRGGYNPTPTVRQFRIAMQQNMSIRLQMSTETGNCMVSEGDFLEIDDNKAVLHEPNSECEEGYSNDKENGPTAQTTTNRIEANAESTPQPHTSHSTLEECSNAYVAGYLLYKVNQKFGCNVCASKYQKEDGPKINRNELLLFFKDYGCAGNTVTFLKTPSEKFNNIVRNLLVSFNVAFDQYKSAPDVSKNIKHYLQNSVVWGETLENPSCAYHNDFILNLFIKMKMFRHLKWETVKQETNAGKKNIKSNNKPHRKVSILSKSKNIFL